MANRAERRRADRAHTKAIKNRGGPPPAERPIGEHGVNVEAAEDGFVYLTFYGGYSTFIVKWTQEDAKIIGDMILTAADGTDAVGKGIEVVRDSGLVIPPPGRTDV